MSDRHPAVSKFYEIIIGGIYYSVQCDEVVTRQDGVQIARCHWLNGRGPGSSDIVSIPVDAEGNEL